ncbi:hypothetical protein [Dysgonomonas macrotermitis]|nr:hypothetical protein [Dysgonomonas macrotermitis]
MDKPLSGIILERQQKNNDSARDGLPSQLIFRKWIYTTKGTKALKNAPSF